VLMSLLPIRFQQNLKKYEDKRIRTSAVKLQLKANILSEVTSRSAFLLKEVWAGFHDDILSLQELTQSTLQNLQRDTERIQRNQKKPDRSVGCQLRDAETTEPTTNSDACYLPLEEILLEFGNYQELLVSSEQIDLWSPPYIEHENLEAARQRRHRFWKGMFLAFPYRSIKFDAGGRRELIYIVWKIPSKPQHRCQTSDANVIARILKKIPSYASRQVNGTPSRQNMGMRWAVVSLSQCFITCTVIFPMMRPLLAIKSWNNASLGTV
jgi:hypothetical protein